MDRFKNIFINNDESGFSMVEIIIAMAIFSIFIIPIFSMVLASGKNTANSKRYYDATVMSQNLSEEIKYKLSEIFAKHDPFHNTAGIDPIGDKGTAVEIDDFLDMDPDVFEETFKTNDYYYEVYIRETDDTTESYTMGNPSDLYILKKGPMTVPVVAGGSFPATPLDSVDLTLSSNDFTPYFNIEYESENPDIVKENLTFGYVDGNWTTDSPENGTDLTISYDSSKRRYNISVGENTTLTTDDIIKLNIDLTRANEELSLNELVIKVKNKSKAKVVLSVFRSTNEYDKNLKIIPVQENKEGNIFLDMKTKIIPRPNYIIKIIVRDARETQNGKILKEMTDIYSHDYRILTF
ncbi:MAG TPA: prepilin-type N-terminal cleavage/methylation domain-containing protein [Defluviitaleaceae bacterium]|jgi:prepilin-type N-terminal cleavage/methylation domain-containing protein|nr:prepilin-type N-terminal cleavage/methylation domain-containing protein [Defluviitaleaceae bacterium]